MTEFSNAPENSKDEVKRGFGWYIKEILSWVLPIAGAVLLTFVLRTYVFGLIVVDGPSMRMTLVKDEIVFINKLNYTPENVRRGDIVICDFPNRTDTFIKRVIALPGEELEIKEGYVYINGEQIDEDGYVLFDHRSYENYGPVTLGADEYMVMGDNRADSHDSRGVGPITGEMIKGRAALILWPTDKWRVLSRIEE